MNFYPFKLSGSRTDISVENWIEGYCAVTKATYHYPPEVLRMVPNVHRGHYCGYVAIPIKDHPEIVEWSTDDWHRHPLEGVPVHGGVTYYEYQYDDFNLKGILSRFVNSSHAWLDYSIDVSMSRREWVKEQESQMSPSWLVMGFDCNHLGDDTDPRFTNWKNIMRMAQQFEEDIHKEIRNILFKSYALDEAHAKRSEDTEEVLS